MQWQSSTDAIRFPLFTFLEGGVTYEGILIASSETIIPEPGTALLIGLGLIGLAARRPTLH